MSVVRTNYGELRGVQGEGCAAFLGIPFARPPVGELRFRAPQPPDPWSGVREATATAPTAPQVVNEELQALLPSAPEEQDEDCLYLNVFTPAADGGKRPVMVWIHGGAFTQGSGSSPMYDGSRLARRGDVVVVTTNYRLGALGFLCLEGDDGGEEPFTNFGMLDQIAALRWVRTEISTFGGDPENVTIFGESAGGMSVGALMASPLASGLFRRAIPQSGAGHNALSVDTARSVASRFARAIGAGTPTREALAGIEVSRILEVQAQLEAELMSAMEEGGPAEMRFQPVIDGHFLEQLPVEAVRRGASRGVSLLVGTTAEESRLFTAMNPAAASPGEAEVVRAFAARLADPKDEVTGREGLRHYRAAREGRGEGVTPMDLTVAIDTDYMFTIPAVRLAEAQAVSQPQVFMYRFDWRSPLLGGALGACHALELPFVFGTLELPGLANFTGGGSEALELSTAIMEAWAAFARSGDPSTPGLRWPAYDASTRATMILDSARRVEDRPHESERLCWEGRR